MQPPSYNQSVSFQSEETNLVAGRSTVRTPALDAELSAISLSVNAIITNLTAIQRDDLELRDQIVKIHTLSTEVLNLLGSNGFNPVGPWLTATSYTKKDVVTQGTGTYVATVDHVSGVFATDLAAGKWVLIFDSATLTASAITVTPVGGIASSNVQGALAELDTEKAAKAANLSDLTDAAAARSNISVHSRAENQQAVGRYAANTGTGDALIAAFVPAIADLTNNLRLVVKASAPNTIIAPTFTPNNGVVAPVEIVKFSNQALVPGDIAGGGHVLDLVYDTVVAKWVLLNPAYNPTLPSVRGSDIAAAGTLTIPDNGNYFYVTGTGTVTDFSTKPAGARITLRFVSGSVILKHSSSLSLQSETDSTPSPDELISFRSEGSGVWIEESRRELPARFLVAMKLALAQLAR